MNPERARDLIGRFDQNVLVVGDVMLDRFVRGTVSKYSPEAPECPVLDFISETKMPGGAANVAMNVKALGANCTLLGVVGDDSAGNLLKHLVHRQGILSFFLISSASTTTKTRFIADDTHFLRFDTEEPILEGSCHTLLLSRVRALVGEMDAVILEDYDKGVLTRNVIREIMQIAKAADVPVFVDPKRDHWLLFEGAELLKPNMLEAFSALKLKPNYTVENVGLLLRKKTGAKTVVITRGADGMSVFSDKEFGWTLPSPVDVVDVSGAGDTAMAALTLARLSGASWLESVVLANTATGIVVGKRGTSTVSSEEVLSYFRS